MLNTIKINCTDCFSVICSDFEMKVTDEAFMVGNRGTNTYKGLLYVDTGEFPVDSILSSARLKIFVQQAKTDSQDYTLYFRPLLYDCGTFGIPEPDNQQDQISVLVEKDHCGWLDIDLLGIAKNWCGKASKNYGLLISTDKSESVITFSNSLENPEMILKISGEESFEDNDIQIVQKLWKFKFYKTEISPPVNISRMKQATFFITNKGGNSIAVNVETSADLFHWVKDSRKVITDKNTAVLVGKYYGRFYRLRFFSIGSGEAEVNFIGQYYSRGFHRKQLRWNCLKLNKQPTESHEDMRPD